ncbi:AraC family transcriptional regulator [Vibrio mimicus]
MKVTMTVKISVSEETKQYLINSSQLKGLSKQGIFECGFAYTKDLFKVSRERPDKYMVIFSISGTGCITVGGIKHRLGENTVAYLPCNIPHLIEHIEEEWRITWLALDSQDLICKLPNVPQIKGCLNGILLHNTIQNLQIIRNDITVDPKLLELNLMQLRMVLENSYPIQRDETELKLLNLFQKVEMQTHKDWTVDTLASLYPCSVVHLYRLCEQYFGHGPKKQIMKIRMEHARQLLIGTTMSIKAVGETIGFLNSANFSTSFKKWYFKSPSNYRKHHDVLD